VPARLTDPIAQEVTMQDWSGYVRKRMWKDTVSMLRDRPVLGAGFGAYPTVFKPYQTTTGIEVFQYPHNILLNLWSETGLLGVIAFGWVIATWVRLGHGRVWTLLPLITILVHGLVDVPYLKNDLAFAFWIFALLATPIVRSDPL
jgi:O-antigen ligase